MNKILQEFAREQLKKSLHKCYPTQRRMFARMYSHKNLFLSVDEMVDEMPADRLDWAITQVDNTVKGNEKLLEEYYDSM